MFGLMATGLRREVAGSGEGAHGSGRLMQEPTGRILTTTTIQTDGTFTRATGPAKTAEITTGTTIRIADDFRLQAWSSRTRTKGTERRASQYL